MIPSQLTSSTPLAFAAGFAALDLLFLLFAPTVIILVANRAEPDVRGMRPFTVYLFGMSIFALNLAFAGVTLMVTALLSFISPHSAPIGNSVARYCVIGGILLIVAGSVLALHQRQGVAAARADGRVDGPSARVLHSYIGVVSVTYVVAAMISIGAIVYLIFQLIAGGVFGTISTKMGTLNILLDFAYVLVASGALVAYMWRLAPSGTLRRPSLPSPSPQQVGPTAHA
jgi:hypothetical protein